MPYFVFLCRCMCGEEGVRMVAKIMCCEFMKVPNFEGHWEALQMHICCTIGNEQVTPFQDVVICKKCGCGIVAIENYSSVYAKRLFFAKHAFRLH